MMGKMMGKKGITFASAKALREPGMHPDGDVPGLYLRVAPGGSKSWILRTVIQGRRRDIGLGGFAVVPIADARAQAREYRAMARRGGDPLAERRKASVPTFKDAAARVHREQIVPTSRNGKHKDQWLTTLEHYVHPVIGEMNVDAVSSADVLRVLSKLWIEKPETARRVKQRMQTVFAWARQAGYRDAANPVDDVATALPRQREKTQHFAALNWQDVPAFWQDLQNQEGVAAKALSFLILNAARTGEVIGARWEEIDFDTAVWTIPASRMKTGIEHRKPLPTAALVILNEMKERGGSYIFPGQRNDRPLSNMAMLTLLKRMQRSDMTVHGFRTSFRVWAAEQTDTPREIAEMCLAHDISSDVERAYSRTDYFQKRSKLMVKWAAWCMAARGAQ
jgi:integrase